jgi:hypothetical protein
MSTISASQAAISAGRSSRIERSNSNGRLSTTSDSVINAKSLRFSRSTPSASVTGWKR